MKRKLKRLEQILTENRGCSIVGDCIANDKWDCRGINFKMIPLFGTEIDALACEHWSFHESWFEQPAKKKLYAFKNNETKEISYFEANETCYSDESRCPDYDIEFGDDK